MRDSLGASIRLTRGGRPSTAGLTAGIAVVVALGPVLGTVLLLATDLPHYVSWLASAAVMAVATAWAGVALALGLYSAEAASRIPVAGDPRERQPCGADRRGAQPLIAAAAAAWFAARCRSPSVWMGSGLRSITTFLTVPVKAYGARSR